MLRATVSVGSYHFSVIMLEIVSARARRMRGDTSLIPIFVVVDAHTLAAEP